MKIDLHGKMVCDYVLAKNIIRKSRTLHGVGCGTEHSHDSGKFSLSHTSHGNSPNDQSNSGTDANDREIKG